MTIQFLQVCRYRKCLEAGMKPDKVDAGWPKRSAPPQDHHQEGVQEGQFIRK